MKIAIHGKHLSDNVIPKVNEVLVFLQNKGARLIITESFSHILKNCDICPGDFTMVTQHDLTQTEFFFSFGGDGTLLDSITYVGPNETPILGINTGRLGFLANTTIEEALNVLDKVLDNQYEIESRMLIRAESSDHSFEGPKFGLNEFAILKQDTSSMITVHTNLDGQYLNSYWADGLIISTPTGSTGYSLSCGGPIIYPHSHSFIVTPVSPHNLNVRPIVISDKSTLTLEVESRSDFYLVSLDSRSTIVSSDIKFTVMKERFEAKLINTGSNTFIDTIRKKLNWGLDLRN